MGKSAKFLIPTIPYLKAFGCWAAGAFRKGVKHLKHKEPTKTVGIRAPIIISIQLAKSATPEKPKRDMLKWIRVLNS